LLKELRRIFLVGIFATAPLGLTVFLLWKLFGWLDDLFQPVIQPVWLQYFSRPIPGLGILVGILFVFIVGLVAPSILGKQILFLMDKTLERLPVAKWIYSGTKQIFDSFGKSNLSKFNRVVMVRFPQTGSHAIGFVTQEIPNLDLRDGTQGKKLVVFIPTTPNPTSGYIVFVSEADSIPLEMSVDEALKFIISVGLVGSQGLQTK